MVFSGKDRKFFDRMCTTSTVAAPGLGIWGGIWGANSYFGGAR